MSEGVDSDEDVLAAFGPAMQALNPKRRKFVQLLVQNPLMTQAKAALAAGYGGGRDGDPKNRGDVCKQIGHRLCHDERVIAAIFEEASREVRSTGLIVGLRVMHRIATTDGHKDQARMAEALVGRAGMPSVMEFRHRDVSSDDKGAAWQLKRIMELAGLLGIDSAALKDKLFGANAAALSAPVEGEFKVVEEVAHGEGR